jgi:hypothetical protein
MFKEMQYMVYIYVYNSKVFLIFKSATYSIPIENFIFAEIKQVTITKAQNLINGQNWSLRL